MAVPQGSRCSTACRDTSAATQGESGKLSDSGISSEEMGEEGREGGKGEEGGWSWLVVLAG